MHAAMVKSEDMMLTGRVYDAEEGLFVESLMAAIAQSSDEAKILMAEFQAGRASKVTRVAGETNGSGPARDGEEA